MKILLCGNYSNVHTELADALKKLNHEVTVLSDGDGYKNYPADIKLNYQEGEKSFLGNFFYMLFDLVGLAGLRNYLKFKKSVVLDDYDVIQVINPVVIPHFGALGNILFLKYLRKKAGRFFLCALGDDTRWVRACLTNKYKYSSLDRLSFFNIHRYYYSLKYLISPAYLILNLYAEKISKTVIAGLDDYKLAYESSGNDLAFIRLPVGQERFSKPVMKNEGSNEVVTIFHAWQKGKELRKGNDILDEAVKKIVDVYGVERVRYIIATDMPFEEYIKCYDECDIYLDQIYSYDGGVTSALGLSAGKVVFSGFELFDRYSSVAPSSIKNVGVNATADVNELFLCLSYLIDNPSDLQQLKNNAYDYAVNEYRSDLIAAQYLNVWKGEAFRNYDLVGNA